MALIDFGLDVPVWFINPIPPPSPPHVLQDLWRVQFGRADLPLLHMGLMSQFQVPRMFLQDTVQRDSSIWKDVVGWFLVERPKGVRPGLI